MIEEAAIAIRPAEVGDLEACAQLALANALWFCTNARNTASLQLHQALGFTEVTRDFAMPRLTFEGGEGVLSRRSPSH